MLYTILDLNLVWEDRGVKNRRAVPSSNPFDYIRGGYYLDGAALFGGENNVHYHIHYQRNPSGNRVDYSD